MVGSGSKFVGAQEQIFCSGGANVFSDRAPERPAEASHGCLSKLSQHNCGSAGKRESVRGVAFMFAHWLLLNCGFKFVHICIHRFAYRFAHRFAHIFAYLFAHRFAHSVFQDSSESRVGLVIGGRHSSQVGKVYLRSAYSLEATRSLSRFLWPRRRMADCFSQPRL